MRMFVKSAALVVFLTAARVESFTLAPKSQTKQRCNPLLYRPHPMEELEYDYDSPPRRRQAIDQEYVPPDLYSYHHHEEEYPPPYPPRDSYHPYEQEDYAFPREEPGYFRQEEDYYYYNHQEHHGPFEEENWNRFYGTSMNSRREFDNFYEQRNYDTQSDSIPPERQQQRPRPRNRNFPRRGESLDRRIFNRHKKRHNAVAMNSDSIPGRDQGYAHAKDPHGVFNAGGRPRRHGDLWSQVFEGSRSMLTNMRRTSHAPGLLSNDLKSAIKDQQATLLPVLEEALAMVRADPACQDLLGADIRLDQPLTQSQSSEFVQGQPQQSRIELQLTAEGTRDRGLLDIYCGSGNIHEMILTVGDRRINVQLDVVAPGIELVDRGIHHAHNGNHWVGDHPERRIPPPDFYDAEFEVLPMNHTEAPIP